MDLSGVVGNVQGFISHIINTPQRRRDRRRRKREFRTTREAFGTISSNLSQYERQFLTGARLSYCDYIRGSLDEDIHRYNAYIIAAFEAEGQIEDPYNKLDDRRANRYVAEAMRRVINEARGLGLDVRIANWDGSVFRTNETSNAYNSNGTGAAGGSSWHNMGMAVDVLIYNTRGEPLLGSAEGLIYDNPNGTWYPYNLLQPIAEKYGITWSGSWETMVEAFHFELSTSIGYYSSGTSVRQFKEDIDAYMISEGYNDWYDARDEFVNKKLIENGVATAEEIEEITAGIEETTERVPITYNRFEVPALTDRVPEYTLHHGELSGEEIIRGSTCYNNFVATGTIINHLSYQKIENVDKYLDIHNEATKDAVVDRWERERITYLNMAKRDTYSGPQKTGERIGVVSKIEESGSLDNRAKRIENNGWISFGSYQILWTGQPNDTMSQFVEWAKDDGRFLSVEQGNNKQLRELEFPVEDAEVITEAWMTIANYLDPAIQTEFEMSQHYFIMENMYYPAIQYTAERIINFIENTPSLDDQSKYILQKLSEDNGNKLLNLNKAIREYVWSTAVQMGIGSETADRGAAITIEHALRNLIETENDKIRVYEALTDTENDIFNCKGS